MSSSVITENAFTFHKISDILFKDMLSARREGQGSECLIPLLKKDFHNHYKNTPIQIYRKFRLKKLKIFR